MSDLVLIPFALIGLVSVLLGVRELMLRARYGKNHAKVLRPGFNVNRKHQKRRKAA